MNTTKYLPLWVSTYRDRNYIMYLPCPIYFHIITTIVIYTTHHSRLENFHCKFLRALHNFINQNHFWKKSFNQIFFLALKKKSAPHCERKNLHIPWINHLGSICICVVVHTYIGSEIWRIVDAFFPLTQINMYIHLDTYRCIYL